jgi:membrane fusion protein (multidrug efflux system)
VDIRVDAFPDLRIKGTVASLSEATGAKFAMLPPDNASGNFVKVTQRVPIKIWIDDIDQYRSLLRAGMSTFIVAEK